MLVCVCGGIVVVMILYSSVFMKMLVVRVCWGINDWCCIGVFC